MTDGVAEPPRQHERHDEPAGESEAENGDAPGPQRRDPIEDQRHRDAGGDQPRADVGNRFRVNPIDAVHPARFVGRRRPRSRRPRQHRADIALRVAASREDGSIEGGDRHHRVIWQRQ
jgi:hypothetical protein